ncbi:hypothetical protein FRC18_004518 [Serendipita sp. 400]|nr:hypothetical protein FRC18_004518 [Serendipita sp. 400]
MRAGSRLPGVINNYEDSQGYKPSSENLIQHQWFTTVVIAYLKRIPTLDWPKFHQRSE